MNKKQKEFSDKMFNEFANITRAYAALLTGRKKVESKEVKQEKEQENDDTKISSL